MSASWNNPALINKISDDVPAIKNLLIALFKMTDSNTEDVPVNAKRLQEVTGGVQFQNYTGSTWANIGKLMHDVDMLDGKHATSSATADTIPVRDADGKLAGDILGNANTATTAASVAAGYVVPVANGGTGASDEAGARTNLGTNNAANITEGVLAIARGGTGSGTKNFVDLSTSQIIGGNKTFSGEVTLNKNVLKMTVLDTTEGATNERTDTVLQGISSNSGYGINVLFGGNGHTVIAAGEGKSNLFAELAGNTEEVVSVIADGEIRLIVNANTYANKKIITLNNAGELSGLAKVTATSFVGNVTGNCSGSSGSCTGNAATATKQACVVSADGNYADVVNVTDGTKRVGTIRITNGNGFTEMLLGVHNESNSAPGGLAIKSTNGALTASFNGDLTATKFSGPLTGNVTGNVTGNCSGSSGSCTGNAASATKLQTARTINGVSFNGTANITVADSTKVAKAGDTMTGVLTSTASNAAIVLKNPNYTKGTAPSSTQWEYVEFMDKAGKRMGWMGSVYYNSKMTRMSMNVRKSNAAADTAEGALGVEILADGTTYGTAPTPAASSNTIHIATTAWVRARLGNGEFGMVPSGAGMIGRKNGTTYTAGTNGYVYGRNSKYATCGKETYVEVIGWDRAWMQHTAYGSGSCNMDTTVCLPVKKGQQYKGGNLDFLGFIPV